MTNKRLFSLDAIRALAIVLVVVNHTFKLDTLSLPQAAVRCIGLAGVPLFLMLTGYLNSSKTFEDYYIKGKWRNCLPVITSYIILGSICYFCTNMYDGKDISVFDYGRKLLQFQLTPYGWYVEMWIGLFFLTPFLNMVITQLNPKSEKYLIITLLSLTSFASFINRNGNNILPNYWVSLYPITIYYLGYYLKTHQIKISGWLVLSVILTVMVGEPLLNLIMNTKKYLYFWGGQDDIIYVTLAFSIFCIIKHCKIPSYINKYMGGVISSISIVSFHIYIISYTFDHIWHEYFKDRYFSDNSIENFHLYFIILLISFTCSYFASLVYAKVEKRIFNK